MKFSMEKTIHPMEKTIEIETLGFSKTSGHPSCTYWEETDY